MKCPIIKLFTVYGELRGKQLFYGTTFLPLCNRGYFNDGDKGYFIVLLTDRGFTILDLLKPHDEG